MDGYRFNRIDVKGNLTVMRDQLRQGKLRINWDIPNHFRIEVASAFGIKPSDFNAEYFDKRTLDRFAHLFAVPRGPHMDWSNPSPDELATTIQNFINRRVDIWSQYRIKRMAADAVTTDLSSAGVDDEALEVAQELAE